MNYKRKLRISLFYFLMMSAIMFIYDSCFVDRWEWPTWILLPYMVFMAIICIIPGILILNLTLRNIYLYHGFSFLLYIPAGLSPYLLKKYGAIIESTKFCSNGLLCLFVVFWIYSFIVAVTGSFAEIYFRKKRFLRK